MIKRRLGSIITVTCCIVCCLVTVIVSSGNIAFESGFASITFTNAPEMIKNYEKLNLAFDLSQEDCYVEIQKRGYKPPHVKDMVYAVKAMRELITRMISLERPEPFVSAIPIPTPTVVPKMRDGIIVSESEPTPTAIPELTNVDCQLVRYYSPHQGDGQMYIYHTQFNIDDEQYGTYSFTALLDGQTLLPYSITVEDYYGQFVSSEMIAHQIEVFSSYWGGDTAIADEKSSDLLQTYYTMNNHLPHIDISKTAGKYNIKSYSFNADTKYYAVRASSKSGVYTLYLITEEILSRNIDMVN